ncbi:MAG TPA: protein kinase [Polyangiaceae bacterium]|nr:protein kinase [Polyangiaceae bacterium]
MQAWPVPEPSAHATAIDTVANATHAVPSFASVDTAQLPDCGEKVGGHCVLRALLGQGAFGRVFAAEDEETGQQVALKVVGLRRYPREYAEHELRALATIAHPNVVQLNEHGVEAGASEPYLWYTMPLYKGADLAALLKGQGCLSLARAHAVFTRIAGGVSEMHRLGLRHQDIKPDNIYLATMAGVAEHHPVLLDLGGAARKGAARPLVATFPFAAPEQTDALIGGLLGDPHEPLTEKVDIYALASTLLFSLIGSDLPGHDIGQSDDDDASPAALVKLRARLGTVHAAREQDPLPAGTLPHLTGVVRERLSRAFQRWLSHSPSNRPTAPEFCEELAVLLEWDAEVARRKAARHVRGTLLRVVGGLSLAACVGGFAGYEWHKRTMSQANQATTDALKKADEAADELHRASANLDTIVDDPALGPVDKARKIAEVVESLEARTRSLLAANAQLKSDGKKAAEQARFRAQQEKLTFDTALAKAEAERDTARTEQASANDARSKAETERDKAQQDKAAADGARLKAEAERDKAQQDKAAAESARLKAEAERDKAQQDEEAAATARQVAEAERDKAQQDKAAEVAAAFARGVTAGAAAPKPAPAN